MDKNDYRNTTYCESFELIEVKKSQLLSEIRKEHPRAIDLYDIVKEEKHKNKYYNIYNYKCSYCGASLLNMPRNYMEVDHFINKSSFFKASEAGKMENLVLSCFACNRLKSSFLLIGKYKELLFPDKEKIMNVFFRDNNYGIKIKKNYEKDLKINEFYNQLLLSSEFRKLDFLLLNLDGLSKDPKAKKIKEKLGYIKAKLLEKRNSIDIYK